MTSTRLHWLWSDKVDPVSRIIEWIAVLSAGGLLVAHVTRFVLTPDMFAWWLPIAVLIGIVIADFASGVIHWLADTWGSEDMPLLGPRLLKPFRTHHVDPEYFLLSDFIDTNGDVATMVVPALIGALFIPLDGGVGAFFALLAVSMCAASLLTNQVHQWTHMKPPPTWVRVLQRCGLLLSREAHQVHHTAPFATHYCMITGWCNGPLSAVRFFPTLERLVTRLTGLTPRSDELHAVATRDSHRPDAVG